MRIASQLRYLLTVVSGAASLVACGSDVRFDPSGSAGSGGAPDVGGTSTGTTGQGAAAAAGGGLGGTGRGGTAGNEQAGGGDGGAGIVGVECGASICSEPALCAVCKPGEQDGEIYCTEQLGDCNDWGMMFGPLYMTCDGHEDCPQNARCSIIEGSIGTYANCWECQDGDCATLCEQNWPPIQCNDLSDCPGCATGCEPYQPGYPVNVCVM